MKHKLLIIGLCLALGLVFERMVIAKTPAVPNEWNNASMTLNDGTTEGYLPEGMVGLFNIGEELYFRDVNGHIGKAKMDESRMYSRAYTPTTYDITWENELVSSYTPDPLYKLDEEQNLALLVRMPEIGSEASPKIQLFEETHGNDW